MSEFEARLKVDGETDAPIHVLVDVTDERLVLSAASADITSWPRHQLRVSALPDGFHIRSAGEAVVLDVTDNAYFAVELGLKNAHPYLRRKMSALLRDEELLGLE